MGSIKRANLDLDEYRVSIIVAICHLSDAIKHLTFAYGSASGPTNIAADLRMVKQAIRDGSNEAAKATRLLEGPCLRQGGGRHND